MRAQTPLRGRDAELATLATLVSGAAKGTLSIAVIEGEPGIGKSRLLAEALRLASDRGFGWTIGRATELDAHRPFGAIVEAMGAWSVREWSTEATADEFSARLRETHEEDRGLQFRLTDRAIELLERFALAQPVALAIDDLHWADASTLRTLQSAAYRLTTYPVLLLASLRPIPRSPPLDGMVDGWLRRGATHLLLAPLDAGATDEIARDVLGADPEPRLQAQLRGTGGNPLFLTELLAAVQGERPPTSSVEAETTEVAEATVPPGLRVILLRRLSVLPGEAIELLRLAAVLGEWFEVRELAALSGRPAAELVTLLDAPRAAGILEEDGAGLRFRHELIRDAIYQDLPATLRAALHVQAGEALAAAGLPASRVAHHLALSAQPGDVRAIGWLRRAASEAGARDPAAAIGLLR